MQDIERVAAYAREMNEFLMESDLTETKAFIRSFVKEIAIRPGTATIRYTMLTPEDNDIDGADIAEIALSRRVVGSIPSGRASLLPNRKHATLAVRPDVGQQPTVRPPCQAVNPLDGQRDRCLDLQRLVGRYRHLTLR